MALLRLVAQAQLAAPTGGSRFPSTSALSLLSVSRSHGRPHAEYRVCLNAAAGYVLSGCLLGSLDFVGVSNRLWHIAGIAEQEQIAVDAIDTQGESAFERSILPFP